MAKGLGKVTNYNLNIHWDEIVTLKTGRKIPKKITKHHDYRTVHMEKTYKTIPVGNLVNTSN